MCSPGHTAHPHIGTQGVHGRSHSTHENCICSPHIPRRFVYPATLLLLAEEPSHGYSLLDKLSEMGVVERGVDLSVVYRVLRHLEEEGLAEADFVEEGQGPVRKVYRLTDEGWEMLSMWSSQMKGVDRLIGEFQKRYDLVREGSKGQASI